MPEYKHTLDPNFSQKMFISIKRFVVIEPAGSIKSEVGSQHSRLGRKDACYFTNTDQ